MDDFRVFKSIGQQPVFTSDSYPVILTMQFLPGRLYKFIYRARRPGDYGLGPPSPALAQRMPCKSE